MKKVYIGLSGGVDSSVSAWLLKEKGYDVHGIFMKNWSAENEQCTIRRDLDDAAAVAEKLNIPLEVVDFSKEYWDMVFEEFLHEIEEGRTPNPDILCNKHIKFDALLKHIKKNGSELLATGHYAICENGNELRRGKDEKKDQSYFLWAIERSILSNVLFPLGELRKQQVREIALDQGLITHNKKDSVGICFIGPKNYRTFLNNYLVTKPGYIKSTQGDIVGEHQGIIFYTIGQRSGISIGGVSGYEEKPWYVVAKDLKKNELIVSQNTHDPLLLSSSLSATRVNWLCEKNDRKEGIVQVRYRHQQPLEEALLLDVGDLSFRVQFLKPQRAIVLGQSVVLYRGNQCLGGGVINENC